MYIKITFKISTKFTEHYKNALSHICTLNNSKTSVRWCNQNKIIFVETVVDSVPVLMETAGGTDIIIHRDWVCWVP